MLVLLDTPLLGPTEGVVMIKFSRLDRVLASNSFINIFNPLRVIHLHRYDSNHSAIRINLEADQAEKEGKKRYQFKFEEN